MGFFDLFRSKNNENLEVARAMAIHGNKDRTQIEHERSLGIKHDALRDEDLYALFDALCYNYTEVEVTDERGQKSKQVAIGGIKQDYVAMRAMISQNQSLRFFSRRDAEIFNLETELNMLILEAQQPVENATVEQSVFFNTVTQLARANNIDSIEGRKLRTMLVDVNTSRVEVGTLNNKKESVI